MSGDQTTSAESGSGMVSRIMRIGLWSLPVFAFVVLTGSVLLVETPYHFLLGWAHHAMRTLPPLLPQWRNLLFPLVCLVFAGWMAHRFVCWWIKARNLVIDWRPAQTAASLSILLLVSAAAIALSGITHQSAWLLGEPWIENRGRKSEVTAAVNNARQLMMALDEYHDLHGRYPDSLQQLRSIEGFSENLLWFEPGQGKAREPFVLLTPGQERPLDEKLPVIVSPLIGSAGKVVVGYPDASVRTLMAIQFERIQQERKATRRQAIPSPHE